MAFALKILWATKSGANFTIGPTTTDTVLLL